MDSFDPFVVTEAYLSRLKAARCKALVLMRQAEVVDPEQYLIDLPLLEPAPSVVDYISSIRLGED